MKTMKKTISLLLATLMVGSICVANVSAATETYDNPTGNYPVQVTVTKGSSYTVTIPKTIVLDGSTDTAIGSYAVQVTGNLSGTEVISVVPDASFALTQTGKDPLTAIVTQDKTEWYTNDVLATNPVIGDGTIVADGLTAGSWKGSFNFTINKIETSISVTAKDSNGNNLNAFSNTIIGAEKDALLTKLDQSGLLENVESLNGVEDVDAIIEVESDNFNGLAETTFDVSNIANEGDWVVILHFNETTNEWEYIDTKEVTAEGTVTADFSSYSPVAFAVVKADGSYEIVETLTYNTVLAKNDWSTIQKVIQAGKVSEAGWQVGDLTPKFSINGKSYRQARIVDIEGDKVTFMLTSSVGNHNMNSASADYPMGDNIGGYADSEMRTWLDEDVYNSLDADLKAVISLTTITCADGYNNPNGTKDIDCYLFLPSMKEVGLNDDIASWYSYMTAIEAEGETFDWFKSNITEDWFWLRSPHSEYENVFFLYYDGYNDYTDADVGYIVCPAFVIN